MRVRGQAPSYSINSSPRSQDSQLLVPPQLLDFPNLKLNTSNLLIPKPRPVAHRNLTMFRIQPARAVQRATFSRAAIVRPRFLSTTPARFAQKDAQDKDSLKPRSTEYAKSGSDDGAAHSDAAFDPKQTSPEEAEATAEKEAGGPQNSLNASPGNKKVSEPNSPDVGGNGGAPDKKSSGGGSAPKNSTG